MFGVKDLFTTINVVGGAVAICLCIDGRPYAAGIAVMLGYLLGDTLDGWVARKLNSANEFGAEFDTIADHTAHVIAPAAIVYTVYKDAGLVAEPWGRVLAMALAASMIVTVSIRHARNIVAPVSFKGIWTGLPRTVFGFLAIGYVNANLAPELPGGLWLGVFLIPFLGFATLTYWPFPSHHLVRSHFRWVKVSIVACFAVTIAAGFAHPAYFFDVLFFWMAGYSLAARAAFTPEERASHRAKVDAARATLQSTPG
jgi:phosphatidylserine synthase